jgi:hypothetical protein
MNFNNSVGLARTCNSDYQRRLVAWWRKLNFEPFQASDEGSTDHFWPASILAKFLSAAWPCQIASAIVRCPRQASCKIAIFRFSKTNSSFVRRRHRASQIASAGVRPCSSRGWLSAQRANCTSSLERRLFNGFKRHRRDRSAAVASAARSSSVKRASRPSISIAFVVWSKMLSAALTLASRNFLKVIAACPHSLLSRLANSFLVGAGLLSR